MASPPRTPTRPGETTFSPSVQPTEVVAPSQPTPPDTPYNTVPLRLSIPIDPGDCHTTPTSSPSNRQAFSRDQIKNIASTLDQARDSGEFPRTVASYTDDQAIIEDYNSLMQLRDVRGNLAEPASEAYQRLRVETARRIMERDAALDDTAHQEEVARRVDTYLRSVEQERRCFEDATALMLQRRGIARPPHLDLERVREEIFSIVENAVEQSVADATSPLRMNIGNLHNETEDLKDQNDTYSRQIDLHYRVLQQATEQQSAAMSSLHAMFGPQSKSLQATTENLQATTQNLSTTTDNLSTLQSLLQPQAQNLEKATDILSTTAENIVEPQSRNLSTLQELLQPQSSNLKTTTENLQSTTENLSTLQTLLEPQSQNLQATGNNLYMTICLFNNLSQLVTNLPEAVNQVVYTSLQHQAQDAFRDILDAQQQVILDLEERSKSLQAMGREVEAAHLRVLGSRSGSRISERTIDLQVPSEHRKGVRGRLRSMGKKIFSQRKWLSV